MIKRILLALVLAVLLGGSALAAQNGDNGNNGNGNNGNNGGNGNRAQLPEPSSLILLLSGAGAVAWKLRSRRK
jgi:opacity protein-like surface antigen